MNMSKAEIFDFVKSAKPEGFARDTGRNAWLAAAGKVVDKIKDVNSVPQNGPKPGGGE